MSSSLTGQVSNAGTALNKRLGAFRQRFSTVFGRHHGYDELSTLEQPLVEDGQPREIYDRPDRYFEQHGVHQPGQELAGSRFGASRGSSTATATSTAAGSSLPDPVQELRECSDLAKEAAEILWEMAALNDTGEGAAEMLGKSQQLQAQLRGMIGDFSSADETVLARALEAFETLSNTLAEYHKGTGAQQTSAQQLQSGQPGETFRLQPPQNSPANPFSAAKPPASTKQPVDDEPPLITFD